MAGFDRENVVSHLQTRAARPFIVALLLVLFAASPGQAALVNGDFEDPALSNGGISQSVNGWFESTTAWNDWVYRDSGAFVTDSNILGLSTNSAYIYQKIGTYTPGAQVLVTGEAHLRRNATFRGFNLNLYVGNVTGADGSRLSTLGATLLDTEPFTGASLGLTGPSPAMTNFNSTLDMGLIGTLGEDIWLEITPGLIVTETFLDNLTATIVPAAAGVPEPSTLVLAGFSCLGMLVIARKKLARARRA